MKNYVNDGKSVVCSAPYALSSGNGFLIGLMFAVAMADAANGAEVVGATEGVFDITAKAADTGAFGALIYWDDAAKQLTTTATSNTKVGVLVAAKTNAQTTARVRLNGAF